MTQVGPVSMRILYWGREKAVPARGARPLLALTLEGGPPAKIQGPLGLESKETPLPCGPQKEPALPTPQLLPGETSSDLQNWKVTYVCYFKQARLWHLFGSNRTC